jgi:hypothetical protein
LPAISSKVPCMCEHIGVGAAFISTISKRCENNADAAMKKSLIEITAHSSFENTSGNTIIYVVE